MGSESFLASVAVGAQLVEFRACPGRPAELKLDDTAGSDRPRLDQRGQHRSYPGAAEPGQRAGVRQMAHPGTTSSARTGVPRPKRSFWGSAAGVGSRVTDGGWCGSPARRLSALISGARRSGSAGGAWWLGEPASASLEVEMDAQCLVEFGDERGGQLSYSFADPLDRHRADLLGLRLGVTRQPGLACWQQNLEWVDARDVRGHRHYRDHAPAEPGGCGVGRVVADDDREAGLGGSRSAGGVKVDGDDLAAAHSAAQAVRYGSLPCS